MRGIEQKAQGRAKGVAGLQQFRGLHGRAGAAPLTDKLSKERPCLQAAICMQSMYQWLRTCRIETKQANEQEFMYVRAHTHVHTCTIQDACRRVHTHTAHELARTHGSRKECVCLDFGVPYHTHPPPLHVSTLVCVPHHIMHHITSCTTSHHAPHHIMHHTNAVWQWC